MMSVEKAMDFASIENVWKKRCGQAHLNAIVGFNLMILLSNILFFES